MLTPTALRRIFLASAAYDLIVTAPFATPWSLAALTSGLNALHGALGLPPLAPIPPEAVLYTNFFGSVVLVWATLRLRAGLIWLARYDAVARWLFSLWMAYALYSGATPLIWAFLLIEASFGLLQSLPLRATTGARP